MQNIEPVGELTKNEIIERVAEYILRSENIFGQAFKPVEVLFDLTGRSAGMYKVFRGKQVIRFNPYHFSKYLEENMLETIPHEVAHYITDQVYGLRNIRPHGKEWQALMLRFGVEPRRTFSYSLEGIPTRTQKRFPYACSCMQFEITTRRHNSIQKGRMEYRCRQCGSKIKYIHAAK